MLVLSQALALAAASDITADNPVIGWHNLVTASNIVADGEEADHPASNLANPATYLKWVATDDSEQHLTVTLNSVDEQDYIAVARHNWGSESIVVSVEHFVDPDWVELVEEVLLPDDSPALFRFTPTALVQIRFRLQPPADAIPQAGVVYCGALTALPRKVGVGHTPMKYGRAPNIVNGVSENGEYLGSIQVGGMRENTLRLQNLDPDWYRDNLDPMVEARQPFFFAWRPQTRPREVSYAWYTNAPRPVNQRPNRMVSIDFELEGVA